MSKVWARYGSRPTQSTCPALPNIVTWIRLFIGLLYGAYLGATGITGSRGIMMGAGLITFVPMLYVEHYLKTDVESYNNSLMFAGAPNAFAFMCLVWILLHTWNNEETEQALGAAVAEIALKAAEISVDDDSGESAAPVVGDSEF